MLSARCARLAASRASRASRAYASAAGAAPVKFHEVAEEALPEGVACLRRESEVIEGAPLMLERATTRELLAMLAALGEAPVEALAEPTLAGDTDWTLDGFTTFSSKTFRLTCAKTGAARAPLPRRDAYLLTGPRGSGKSVALATCVHWARKNGWLALYVPRGWDVMFQGDYVVPSAHHEGKFEEPRGSRAILESFRAAHGAACAAVPVRDDAVADRWSLAGGARTLGGLLDAALEPERLDENSTALLDLRLELGKVTEAPVLVAVDEYTSFLQPMTRYFFDNVNLAPDDLLSIAALRPLGPAGVFDDHKLARGVSILADSASRCSTLDNAAKRRALPHLPFELKLGPYTHDEFRAAVDRYKAAGYVFSDLDADAVTELKMATQRNPQHLFDRLAML